jgi:hypothetical protein
MPVPKNLMGSHGCKNRRFHRKRNFKFGLSISGLFLYYVFTLKKNMTNVYFSTRFIFSRISADLHPTSTSTSYPAPPADVLSRGARNRSVGATQLNERSSRSHAVLTVHAEAFDAVRRRRTRGKLQVLCDPHCAWSAEYQSGRGLS